MTRYLNAEALQGLAIATRKMMILIDILHENITWLIESVVDKRNSFVKPKKWLAGGVVALYAGLYFVCPAWPVFFWVTASS